jgi:hypothetical protein
MRLCLSFEAAMEHNRRQLTRLFQGPTSDHDNNIIKDDSNNTMNKVHWRLVVLETVGRGIVDWHTFSQDTPWQQTG